MRRCHSSAAPPGQFFQNCTAQGSALKGVGSASQFVVDDQRRRTGISQQLGRRRHGSGKGREVGGDVLVVADSAPDVVVPGYGRTWGNGDRNAVITHQDHQAHGLQDDGLAPGVGARNQQGDDIVREGKIQGYDGLESFVPLIFIENLASQDLQTLVQEGMPGLVEDQCGTLARLQKNAFDHSAEEHPGLNGIDQAKGLDGLGKVVLDGAECRRDLEEDPLDLPPFLGCCICEIVVVLDNAERFDEGGHSGTGTVQNQSGELCPDRGLDREAVAVSPEGRWRIGHDPGMATANGLQFGDKVLPNTADGSACTCQCRGGIIGNLSVATQAGRRPGNQLLGVR